MAAFRVGQRVRIASEVEWCEHKYRHLLGAETVITSPRYQNNGRFGYRTAATDTIPHCLGVPEEYLSPLTDPKADEFIESLRKLKPLHDHLTAGTNKAQEIIRRVKESA